MSTGSTNRGPAAPKSFLEGCMLVLFCIVFLPYTLYLRVQTRYLRFQLGYPVFGKLKPLAQRDHRSEDTKKPLEDFHATDSKTTTGGMQ